MCGLCTCGYNEDIGILGHDRQLLWGCVAMAHGCRGITSSVAMEQGHQGEPY